jgi:hypothetical protein
MRVILLIVWLTSAGILPEEWKYYPTYRECRDSEELLYSSRDKILFISGCIAEENIERVKLIQMFRKPIHD